MSQKGALNGLFKLLGEQEALCANISETFSPCQIEVGRVGGDYG
jgi:hypothetical protein